MEIRVLEPEVVDQIAAGEVVERPAHLAKELIENSLDAQATRIEIDVDLGGRKLKITDNGRGIYKEDLPLVCARHATSKIAKADDLWSLHTFGFRGEALASISSVSKLKIISKRKEQNKAYVFENNFGVGSEPLLTGADEGTTVEIDDLFANVPARLKFLKSDSAEVTQIKNVVKALALAHPQVEFKFKHQGKVLFYYSQDDSLLNRAAKVLDTKDLFSATNEYQGYRVEVVMSSPHTTTGNSKQIWIFVENRWVGDRTIQAALMESYRSLLMHGEFPLAVVKVFTPEGEVDVNIHPTKSQVKFTDQSFIFRLVHNTVRAQLEKAPWIQTLNRGESAPTSLSSNFPEAPAVADYSLSFRDQAFEQTQYPQKSFVSALEEAGRSRSERWDGGFVHAVAETSGISSALAASETPSDQTFWSRLQVLGQSHLTYILAEGANSLFLIDQHAAHERVVFERLMENWRQGKFEVQDFLLPLTLEAPADQIEALLGLREEFGRMGLQFEQGGPETLLISSSPNFVSEKALVQSLKKFAEECAHIGGSFSFEKKVADIFATMACHSVVRAGQALSLEEMRSLLLQMDDYRLSSYCPHGRNVFVELPFYKIEKDFGRIQ